MCDEELSNFQAKPVLDDEGEQVRHGGGPQPTQGVVVEAGVQRDDVVLGNEENSQNYIGKKINLTKLKQISKKDQGKNKNPPMCSAEMGSELLHAAVAPKLNAEMLDPLMSSPLSTQL